MPAPKPQNKKGVAPKETSPGVPRSWPADIQYLTKPVYSSTITPELSNRLHDVSLAFPASETLSTVKGPTRLVRITPITIPSHPANGQYGLFTTQTLEADGFILFYLGLVHLQSDADLTSDYDLSLDRELGVGIDSAKMGNEARFINDYRGIGSAPNAEFREAWFWTGQGKPERRMGVFVLSAGKSGKRAKGIGKGEEVLVSYGKGFWKERDAEYDKSRSDVQAL